MTSAAPLIAISSDHKHIKSILRPRFHKKTARSRINAPELKPIERIAAVGAIYRRNGFSLRDQFFLRAALEACLRNGFPIARTFEVIPVNLATGPDTGNGHDFLDPEFKIQADLVITCFVINAFNVEGQRMAESCTHYDQGATSPFQSPDVWAQAAIRANASYVSTHTSFCDPGVEVDTRCFMQPSYTREPLRQPLYVHVRDSLWYGPKQRNQATPTTPFVTSLLRRNNLTL